jgi:hypothetical protein
LPALGDAAVQDATGTAVLTAVLLQVVCVQLLPEAAGMTQLDPRLALQPQLVTAVGPVGMVWQVVVCPLLEPAVQLLTPTQLVSVVLQVIV